MNEMAMARYLISNVNLVTHFDHVKWRNAVVDGPMLIPSPADERTHRIYAVDCLLFAKGLLFELSPGINVIFVCRK